MSEINNNHINFLDSAIYKRPYNQFNGRKPYNQPNRRKPYNQPNGRKS